MLLLPLPLLLLVVAVAMLLLPPLLLQRHPVELCVSTIVPHLATEGGVEQLGGEKRPHQRLLPTESCSPAARRNILGRLIIHDGGVRNRLAPQTALRSHRGCRCAAASHRRQIPRLGGRRGGDGGSSLHQIVATPQSPRRKCSTRVCGSQLASDAAPQSPRLECGTRVCGRVFFRVHVTASAARLLFPASSRPITFLHTAAADAHSTGAM